MLAPTSSMLDNWNTLEFDRPDKLMTRKRSTESYIRTILGVCRTWGVVAKNWPDFAGFWRFQGEYLAYLTEIGEINAKNEPVL
jgi:hypothetical protein